jgi:uncharacterized protein YeeX (DUF496 family)
MIKKAVILIGALLICSLFSGIVYSQPDAVTANQTSEVPIAVSMALQKMLEEKKMEKQIMEENAKQKEVFEHIFELILLTGAFVLIFALVMKWGRIIRRKLRRAILYASIAKYAKNKMTFRQIRKELIRKGWKDYHVDDAVSRYEEMIKQNKEFFPNAAFWIKENYAALRRRVRRNILYIKIRKMSRKGLEFKQIEKELVKQGWNPKHAEDAVVRYEEYVEQKRHRREAKFS